MAEAAAPERQLKRALSAFDLTCIGIGAIIGTGIFALAGTAAAGEQAQAIGSIWKTPVLNFIQSWITHAPLVFGRPGAGPAVMLSFVVAGVACGFAALCYAELAAMIPIGMSRCGFFVSSAVVETASNPMKAKNTIAAPLITPPIPVGRKGCQLVG